MSMIHIAGSDAELELCAAQELVSELLTRLGEADLADTYQGMVLQGHKPRITLGTTTDGRTQYMLTDAGLETTWMLN